MSSYSLAALLGTPFVGVTVIPGDRCVSDSGAVLRWRLTADIYTDRSRSESEHHRFCRGQGPFAYSERQVVRQLGGHAMLDLPVSTLRGQVPEAGLTFRAWEDYLRYPVSELRQSQNETLAHL